MLNWIIILLLVPNVVAEYAASPAHDLAGWPCSELDWGLGAVLFGWAGTTRDGIRIPSLWG